MALENEKAAVPIPPALHKESLSSRGALAKCLYYVGAGGEQQLPKTTEQSIAKPAEESNPPSDVFLENMLRLQKLYDPNRLRTVSMSELYENVYLSRPPVIDGLLHVGTYLFVGAPKVGKSFFMAQLAYHVSTGLPLWEYPVHKGAVLYLALEDDHRRLQSRLFRMFGTETTENLYFATEAKQLGAGLDEQLEGQGKCSYANDYEVICRLKQFADYHGICLLLVHHTRKQQAEDKFDMISGTNGLLGAADGAFLLQKEKRTDGTATQNMTRLTWELDRTEAEPWKAPPDPMLEAVSKLVNKENPFWSGTATELVAALGLDIKPNTLSMRLNVSASRLLDEYHIQYESARTHAGRSIKLTWAEPQA